MMRTLLVSIAILATATATNCSYGSCISCLNSNGGTGCYWCWKTNKCYIAGPKSEGGEGYKCSDNNCASIKFQLSSGQS